MSTTTERTAIAAFNLDDRPVRIGQIVNLDALQLKRLAAAGCVALTDEDNALVPKAGLPPTQIGGIDYEATVKEAADEATKAIEGFRARVSEAQAESDRLVLDATERSSKAQALAEEAERNATERSGKALTSAEEAERQAAERVEKANREADEVVRKQADRVFAATAGTETETTANEKTGGKKKD